MRPLRKNALLTYLDQTISLEEDVQDGKLFREREKVIYAKLSDLSELNNAHSADFQEQWGVKIAKSEKNQAKGSIRVRKVIPLIKTANGYKVSEATEQNVQYVMTTKAEKQAEDRLEVPVAVTKDMFDLFRLISDGGMIKHRYHFRVEGSELVFEVDVYLKEDGSYHEWVKIDLELKDEAVEIPKLPVSVDERIDEGEADEKQKKFIGTLYETVFLTKSADAGKFDGMINSVSK